jgi:ABC-type glycerol-3-phosphate transport system permease component
MRKRPTAFIGKALLYAMLSIAALLFLFPFYQMVVGSFKNESEIFTTMQTFLPKALFLDNYTALFRYVPFFRNMLNSMVVSVASTALVLFFSSLAGYAFAKHRFPGRSALFVVLLITLMLPQQVNLVPLFILMRVFGWINTYYPLIIPGAASAFGIFLIRQYVMSSVPNDLLDSAKIDGAGAFRIYRHIVLPIIAPGLTALVLLTFMGSWNNFLWPLIVLNDAAMYTIPLALSTLRGAVRGVVLYGSVFAGSTIGTIPLLAIFLVFQKQFVSGILAGSVKG